VEKIAYWRAEKYFDFAKYVSVTVSKGVKYQAYGMHGRNGIYISG